MAPIRSHQWLELDPIGDTARDSRALRPEERDILTALSAGPLRMVDLFRRLRLTDSAHFQELLARAVGRGWLQVHNDDPRQAPLSSAFAAEPSLETPVDPALALEQLLARYQADPVVTPSAPPEVEPPLAPSSEPLPETVEVAASPPSVPLRVVPPPVMEGPQDDWMAALGVSPVALPASPDPRSAAPAPADDLPVSAAHAELLRALANTPPSAIERPAVKVPAYGLGETIKRPSTEDPGFVRLKDVGAVRGPGDGPLSGSSGSGSVAPSAVPAPPVQTTPSARSRRQNNGREQFLAATRRQAADRENAKLLAQRNKQEQLERKVRHDEAVEQQRKVEASARRPSLRERADRARRIRDGLPPES